MRAICGFVTVFFLLFHNSSFSGELVYGHNVDIGLIEQAPQMFVNFYSGNVERKVIHALGTENHSSLITFKNQEIGYKYQMWKIKHSTVCANVIGNVGELSACTIKAKSLFNYLCSEFMNKDNGFNWKVGKLRMMYCTAATEYQPVVALITTPSSQKEAKLSLLKSKCNSLIFSAMSIDADELIKKERDTICTRYRKAK